jgi:uncharacterized cupin superfamily protein
MNRPSFIKHVDELIVNESFSYPHDDETFGIGAAMGKKLGLARIGINYEILRPGDRSSWPHAHSHDEEFIFILSGHPEMWIDGDVYKLNPGDCIGLPAGTGHAHTLINNTDGDVRAIVVGDAAILGDKIFYPLHPKRNQEMQEKGFFWENHPVLQFGKHDGWSDKKRPVK